VDDIVTRGLSTGEVLPPEVEMLQKYAVGKASMREALRLLEVQGLISIKAGPGGGPVVGVTSASHLARTSSLYFHLGQMTYDELFDTYIELEPLLARSAAENPDRDRVRAAMAPFLGRSGVETDVDEFVSEAREFHVVVSHLAVNRVLALVLRSVSCLVLEHIMAMLDPGAMRHQVLPEHDRIAQAIAMGEAARAEKLMRDHVDEFVGFFKAHWPTGFKRVIAWY
jgi:DNA-binding FadR family transcriptional regulator